MSSIHSLAHGLFVSMIACGLIAAGGADPVQDRLEAAKQKFLNAMKSPARANDRGTQEVSQGDA